MLKDKNIAFIGSGNMGEALIGGLLEAGRVERKNITATDASKKRRDFIAKLLKIKVAQDNARIVRQADIIVLAVKPQVIDIVLKEIKDSINPLQTIISIVAGITTKYIERLLDKKVAVIRVMPNTPALIRTGASAICRGRYARKGDEDTAQAIFTAVGKVVKVKEKLIDAVTGLSGSGPAYVFLFTEALIRSGIRQGLSRKHSEILAKQTVLGAAKMMVEQNEEPADLRRKVTSPGGTTEAALNFFKKKGFSDIIIDAVSVSAGRSKELGKK